MHFSLPTTLTALIAVLSFASASPYAYPDSLDSSTIGAMDSSSDSSSSSNQNSFGSPGAGAGPGQGFNVAKGTIKGAAFMAEYQNARNTRHNGRLVSAVKGIVAEKVAGGALGVLTGGEPQSQATAMRMRMRHRGLDYQVGFDAGHRLARRNAGAGFA